MKKFIILFLVSIISTLVLFSCDSSPQTIPKVVEISVINGYGSGTYKEGSKVEVSCDDDLFKEWVIDGEVVSSEKNYSFVARKDLTITAVLEQQGDIPTEFKDEVLSTNSYLAYSVYNTEQILQDASLPSKIDPKVSFSAAKGENESAQLMIYAKQAISNSAIDISFTNLYNGSNTISKDKIEINLELYQDVKSNWGYTEKQKSSWFPNGYSTLELGMYPDALIPLKAAKVEGYNKLNMAQYHNQGLFFKIDVPENAVSGTYIGQVEITLSNQGTLVLPVELEVYDFTMPKENSCKTMINIDATQMKNVYGTSDDESIYYTSLWNMLADRGVSGGFVSGSPWDTNTVTKYLEYLKKAAKDERIAVYNLDVMYDSGISVTFSYKKSGIKKTETVDNLLLLRAESIYETPTANILGYKELFKYMVDASTNEVNLFKKAIIYFPQADEPNDLAGYLQNILCQNVINQSIDWALINCNFNGKEEVKQSLANLSYMVTSEPIEELYNGYTDFKMISYTGSENCCLNNVLYTKVDGYIPLYPNFLSTSKTYNNICELIKNHPNDLWWYSCIQPTDPYASFIINAPMIRTRVNRWQEYSLGVTGQLFYMCNRSSNYIDSTSTPLKEGQILNGVIYEGAYDDGLLVYPVYNLFDTYNKSTTKTIYYLSSLRLENISEGIDDYNYLVYANELINQITNQTTKTQYQNQLNKIYKSLFSDVTTNTTNHQILSDARNQLANMIETLNKLK